jgi:hypothetical protein
MSRPGSFASTHGRDAEGTAWGSRATELAKWTMRSMVNRITVWGGYHPLDQRQTAA